MERQGPWRIWRTGSRDPRVRTRGLDEWVSGTVPLGRCLLVLLPVLVSVVHLLLQGLLPGPPSVLPHILPLRRPVVTPLVVRSRTPLLRSRVGGTWERTTKGAGGVTPTRVVCHGVPGPADTRPVSSGGPVTSTVHVVRVYGPSTAVHPSYSSARS